MNLKETFGRKLGPLPVWAWALIGGAGMWYLLHKKAGAQPSTNGATGQAVYGTGDFSGAGGGGGSFGAFSPPPTPVGTPPATPYNPPAVLGSGGNGYSGGTYSISLQGPGGQTGSETYTTYNTPSGGPPSYTNPAPWMAGWRAADWQTYAAQLAHEWGGSVEQYLGNLGVPGYTYWSANQSQSQLPSGSRNGTVAAGQMSGASAGTGLNTALLAGSGRL